MLEIPQLLHCLLLMLAMYCTLLSGDMEEPTQSKLVTEFQLSEWCKEVDENLSALLSTAEEGRKNLPEFATNFLWQVRHRFKYL